MIDQSKEHKGLCFRCEYRAQFLEKGHAPRAECGDVNFSCYGCYNYQPVTPIIYKPRDGDKRIGIPGSIISARIERIGLLDYDLKFEKLKKIKGFVLYKIPMTKEAKALRIKKLKEQEQEFRELQKKFNKRKK